MKKVLNQILHRENEKPIVWDAYFKANKTKKPIVVFCHGYKGFKDWGTWHLVAEHFANNHCFFFKFNFSHNGGTIEQPIDFPDLEAFGQNNYTKELKDLDDIINMLTNASCIFHDELNLDSITLIGHSRGGGITIIKAAEDSRITKLITWASVSSFGKRTSTTGDLDQWKKDGVKYVINGRTKQKMPHYYQFYENFIANEERLNIEQACKNLKIPHLIIHGDQDNAVSIEEAYNLEKWSLKSQLIKIDDANHVFNTKHPWLEITLPVQFKKVILSSAEFL